MFGFDFADAWKIFATPMLRDLDEREDYGEDRWIGIGILDARIVVVVFTQREESDEEIIRIISLRKALAHERSKYEQALRDRLGAH
ncbi:hypothetical protein A2V82_15200 [candidate division KSB1 bacterium RBG_16_48_16]|nr:MAG: hypothetical protein A2V82_15200 [candidate division KSB1 bacterium RBG_16_48_16]